MENSAHAVLDALIKAASQNPELLKVAENQLTSWETAPGFYSILLNIAFDHNIDINVRWMAILCAKNGIDKHWRKVITDDEKYAIRHKMLSSLNEPINQIALQLSVLIAKVARYDFPKWQELFPALLNGIQSTEELHHLRALLTGHHVIKTLASKRLTTDRKIFEQVADTIFSTILNQWINYSKSFLDTLQTDVAKASPLLESAFLSLKMLRHLAVYGFKDISKQPDVLKFLLLIFEQVRPFLECRLILMNFEQHRQTVEKYLVLLIKVLHNVEDFHPLEFVPFIQSTLEYAVMYCFNNDFQSYLFERLIVKLLNLLKDTILKQQYTLSRYTHEQKNHIIEEADKTIKSFFSHSVLSEIFTQLLSRYFVLTEAELCSWENNPEDFATEEKGESWKVSLRPCTEVFFLSLMKTFRSTMTPLVVEAVKNLETNNVSSPIDVLKREAVYLVVGLAAFDLYDDIDFSKWFTDILIPELKNKSNGYYIIRRRVVWLIGEWCGVKLTPDLRPLLYEALMHCMIKEENLVVRLTAANSLKSAIDDFGFEEEVFFPLLKDCFALLFQLLMEVVELDLKMPVLSTLTFILERMKPKVKPYVTDLMDYLPRLWDRCGDHNMLRCAIVTCFVELVKCLGEEGNQLHPALYPMITFCTDLTQPPHVYLLEDGLDLWFTIMEYTSTCSASLMNISSNLMSILEYNNENLSLCLRIIEAYILLAPEEYLKRYGQEFMKTSRSIMTDLKSEGINRILGVVETVFIVFPQDGPILFQPLLPFVLKLALDPEELPISLSIYLSLLSRVILHNQTVFVNTVQEKAIESQKNVKIILSELFDVWLPRISFLRPMTSRKLMALALSSLLTSGLEIVYDRFCGILLAIVEVLHDVTKCGGTVRDDLLIMFTPEECLQEIQPEAYTDLVSLHYIRKAETRKLDPVYYVVLRDYFYDQMKALEQSIGTSKFEDLMATVDIETKEQVQYYLQN